ncbi:MAG: hypothetical protein ACUVX1_17550 [Chloroflexota bacterium]
MRRITALRFLGGAAAAAYLLGVRPWYLNGGATDYEVCRFARFWNQFAS